METPKITKMSNTFQIECKQLNLKSILNHILIFDVYKFYVAYDEFRPTNRSCDIRYCLLDC